MVQQSSLGWHYNEFLVNHSRELFSICLYVPFFYLFIFFSIVEYLTVRKNKKKRPFIFIAHCWESCSLVSRRLMTTLCKH